MKPITDAGTFDDLVPKESKYLSKEDVGEDGVILTIKAFTREVLEMDGVREEKTIMHFVEPGIKPMVLNRTNSQLLPAVTGANNVGEAKGKQVVVYNDITVMFGGDRKGGIRLKKIAGTPRSAAPLNEAAGDDIPF